MKLIYKVALSFVLINSAISNSIAATSIDLVEAAKFLDSFNPRTGSTKETEDFWCIANEWKVRDQRAQKKNKFNQRFSHKGSLGKVGATWFCHWK